MESKSEYNEDKMVEALHLANEANDFEAKGDLQQSLDTYKKCIALFETQLQNKPSNLSKLTPHKSDVFQAFLNDWRIKVQSLNNRIAQSKMEEKENIQNENVSKPVIQTDNEQANIQTADEEISDGFVLLKEEIVSGVYYSETC